MEPVDLIVLLILSETVQNAMAGDDNFAARDLALIKASPLHRPSA
jgi:hypothetical protein